MNTDDTGDSTPSSGDSTRSGRAFYPQGAVPLHYSGDSWTLPVDDIIAHTEIEIGNYLGVEAQEGELWFAKVHGQPDDHNDRERKIDTTGRVTLPERLLKATYGDVIETYDPQDPLLFQVGVAQAEMFTLEPLGVASSLFRPAEDGPERVAWPFPTGEAFSIADPDVYGFDESKVRSALRQLSLTLTPAVFEAVGLASGMEPLTVERDGMVLDLHYVPRGGLGAIANILYDQSEAAAEAIQDIHDTIGQQYVDESFEARGETVPDDHPSRQGDVVIIPQGTTERAPEQAVRQLDLIDGTVSIDGESEPEPDQSADTTPAAKSQFPAGVVERTAQFRGLEVDELWETLNAVATTFEPDRFTTHAHADLPAQAVTTDDGVEVTLTFLEDGALADYLQDATDVDVDERVADAVVAVHNQTAERLATDADLAGEIQRFRSVADAVVLPQP